MRKAVAAAALLALVGTACSDGTTKAATPTTASAPTASTPTSAQPSTTASTADPGPPGGPVPNRSQPISVTFVSANEGFVLADAPCAAKPCTSILRTRDGGRHWVGIPAPKAALDTVQRIRFANDRDGWVFGPALYATHDGGATWHAVTTRGPVAALATAAGTVYALIARDKTTLMLYRAPAGTDDWQPVRDVTAAGSANTSPTEAIVLHGTAAWVRIGGASTDSTITIFATSDGRTWRHVPDPCAAARQSQNLVAMAAPTATTVGFLCEGDGAAGSAQKTLLISTDGGATTHEAGKPPMQGTSASLAAASTATWVVPASSGATQFHRSTDGGRTWRTDTSYGDGGLGLSDVGFTTATQGVAIYGGPGRGQDQLLMTFDGGATWRPVKFTSPTG